MKNFLAIDTSSKYMTVLAYIGGEKFFTYKEDCAMKHSSLLMTEIDALLQKAGAKLSDFDFFAAVVGAGSFTGIRIGISTVKGFCTAMKKPALPITSFALAAYTEKEEKLLVLSDALHESFYACGYQNGEVSISPSYISSDEANAYIKEGYTPCSLEPLSIPTKRINPAEGLYNAALSLSENENNFGDLTALYIRKSQAELNLEKGAGV